MNKEGSKASREAGVSYCVGMGEEEPRGRHVVWEVISFEGGLLLLAVGLGWLVGHLPFEHIKFRWQDVGLAVAATGPLLLMLLWCIRSRWSPLMRLLREIQVEVLPLFTSCSVLELAGISVLAGVAEESLFRGVLQAALADSLSPALALVVTSTLFGLAHLITPIYALLAALIGLYLGGLRFVADNLLVPILVHALYDFVALVYLTRKHRYWRRSGDAGEATRV